jgi:hypothetical protein
VPSLAERAKLKRRAAGTRAPDRQRRMLKEQNAQAMAAGVNLDMAGRARSSRAQLQALSRWARTEG